MEPGPESSAASGEESTSLRELALLFLRLGTTAFGGPAAHITMMREEVVLRRKWLSEQTFLDLLGATNLIPGPNSTELAIHIGYGRRRWAGLIVAGVAFIVPAMLLTGAAAWAYQRFGNLPAVEFMFDGIRPAVLALMVRAVWEMLPPAARDRRLRALVIAAAAALFVGVNELVVLFVCGALAALTAKSRGDRKPALGLAFLASAGGAAAKSAITLPALFWTFLKIGSVLFGGGYVLFAFLQAELVERLGWLTQAQLVDAIAVGQLTPGPVFTSATFVGYLLGGAPGALVTTVAIFLPAFIGVALSGPLIPRLRASPAAGAFLDGVNVASVTMIAVAAVELGITVLVDAPSIAIAALAVVASLRFRVHSAWLIAGAATAGVIVRAFP